MANLIINSEFAKSVKERMTGNCDRCGEKNILFDYEVWRYCEKCCEHSEKVNE